MKITLMDTEKPEVDLTPREELMGKTWRSKNTGDVYFCAQCGEDDFVWVSLLDGVYWSDPGEPLFDEFVPVECELIVRPKKG